jgi:tight adherence protein C
MVILAYLAVIVALVALWWALTPERPAEIDTTTGLPVVSGGRSLLGSFRSSIKPEQIDPQLGGSTGPRFTGTVDLGPAPGHELDPEAPDMRRAMLEMSAIPRLLTPAIESIGNKVRRVTPVGFIDRWEKKIALSGMQGRTTVAQILAMKVLGVALGGSMGLFLFLKLGGIKGIGLGLLLFYLGWSYPDSRISKKVQQRQQEIENKLPDVLDQMSVCVEAGLGFDAALLRAAKSAGGALAEEFGRTLQDIRLGASRAEALRALLERSDVAELRMFTRALIQAEKTGVPMAKVLRTQAEDAREKRRQRAEEKAMKLPVKLIFPLMACILPALFVVIIGPAILRVIQAGGFNGNR